MRDYIETTACHCFIQNDLPQISASTCNSSNYCLLLRDVYICYRDSFDLTQKKLGLDPNQFGSRLSQSCHRRVVFFLFSQSTGKNYFDSLTCNLRAVELTVTALGIGCDSPVYWLLQPWALTVTAVTAATPSGTVTVPPISRGIVLNVPADLFEIFQLTPWKGVWRKTATYSLNNGSSGQYSLHPWLA